MKIYDDDKIKAIIKKNQEKYSYSYAKSGQMARLTVGDCRNRIAEAIENLVEIRLVDDEDDSHCGIYYNPSDEIVITEILVESIDQHYLISDLK